MADNCVDQITNGLNPTCKALKQTGGIDKTIYVGNRSELVFTEVDTANGTYYSVAVTGSPTPTLKKFTGKEFKHNYNNEGQAGENVNTINPALTLLLWYFLPAEKQAIEELWQAEDVVAFVRRTGKEGKAYYAIIGKENGLKGSSLTGGSGTVLNDNTSITVVLSGEETTLPEILMMGSFEPTDEGYLQENETALDAISEA